MKNSKKTRNYGPGQHPNSQKNLELAKWKPGQSGNPLGRPKRNLAWSDKIREIGDLINEETLVSNRETLIRDLYNIALDPKTSPTTRYQIAVWLTEREEGKPVQKQEVEAKAWTQNIIFLPAKIDNEIQRSEPVEAEYDEIEEAEEG